MILAIASLLSLADTGPSFDCARAVTAVERAICADVELAVRDRALSLIYAGFPHHFPFGRAGQRRWLAEREACRSHECIRAAYDRRIAALADMSNFSESLRHEGYVGSLSIAPLGEGWHVFSVGTVGMKPGTMEFRTAAAAGVVRIDDGIGRWRHGEGCSLEIRQLARRRWRVIQDEGCARAFSDLTLSGIYMAEEDWWSRR